MLDSSLWWLSVEPTERLTRSVGRSIVQLAEWAAKASVKASPDFTKAVAQLPYESWLTSTSQSGEPLVRMFDVYLADCMENVWKDGDEQGLLEALGEWTAVHIALVHRFYRTASWLLKRNPKLMATQHNGVDVNAFSSAVCGAPLDDVLGDRLTSPSLGAAVKVEPVINDLTTVLKDSVEGLGYPFTCQTEHMCCDIQVPVVDVPTGSRVSDWWPRLLAASQGLLCPVLVRGGVHSICDIQEEFCLERLESTLGGQLCPLEEVPYPKHSDREGDDSKISADDIFGVTTLSQFCNRIKEQNADKNYYFTRTTRAHADMLQRMFKQLPDCTYNAELPMIAFGTAGTGVAPHFHKTAINFCITGCKRWFVFPPDKPHYSGKQVLDWVASSSSTDGSLSIMQLPGDIVFVPGKWSHAVINCATSLAITQQISYIIDKSVAKRVFFL